MAYIDPRTGKQVYTLKEKYQYYKSKAEKANGTNKYGQKIGFTGRVALANRANGIRRKMGKHMRNRDYYLNSNNM